MRTWVGPVLLALAITACGGKTNDPPTQGPVAPGQDCPELGATSPADDGCNSCTCEAAGWSCTEIACLPPDPGGECDDEGSTKPAGDGCNTCTCTDGAWLCTRTACTEPLCEEGDTSDDGCNTCNCTADGQWACTHRSCPPACEEGDVMPSLCGSCVCSGGSWACDEVPCIALCQEGTVKAAGDGCNTCSCTDGAWLCTEKACAIPECPIPDQGCPGAELYGRAKGTDACCELCSSLDGYQYYDSMEACEASKVCTLGDTKYADDQCNTCTCTMEYEWVCTAEECEPTYCGGLGGSACAETEYCAYEADLGGCGILDANAICRPRPTACDDVYAPVCGCDGETYSNACYAAMAGWGVMTDGACEAPPPK